jgi:hypothetical protein
MHTRTHTCTMHSGARARTHLGTYAGACMRTRTHTCTMQHAHGHICMRMCAPRHTCTCAHGHISVHVCTHACTQAYAHKASSCSTFAGFDSQLLPASQSRVAPPTP